MSVGVEEWVTTDFHSKGHEQEKPSGRLEILRLQAGSRRVGDR